MNEIVFKNLKTVRKYNLLKMVYYRDKYNFSKVASQMSDQLYG